MSKTNASKRTGCKCDESSEERFHFVEQMSKVQNVICWSLDEVKAQHSRYATLCEYLDCNDKAPIKPFFDFDCNWETEQEMPTDSTVLESIHNTLKESVRQAFDPEQDIQIYSAWREPGYDAPGKKWKISYRFWVEGVTTSKKQLKALTDANPFSSEGLPDFIKERLSKTNKTLFDNGIYGKNRPMNFVGKYKGYVPQKTGVDKRVLMPLDETDDISHYVIRCVESDWPEAIFKGVEKTTKKTDKNDKKKTGGPIKTVKGLQKELASLGLKSLYSVSLDEFNQMAIAFIEEKTGFEVARPVIKDGLQGNFLMKRRFCPFLNKEHSSNNIYAIIDLTRLRLKCFSCEENSKPALYDVCEFDDFPLGIQDAFLPKIGENDRLNKKVIESLYDHDQRPDRQHALVHYLNHFFAAIRTKTGPAYVWRKSEVERWHDYAHKNWLEIMSENDFFVPTKTGFRQVNITTCFEKNPSMKRIFNDIRFTTEHVGDFGQTLNLFRGWKATPVAKDAFDPSKCNYMIDLFENKVCNGEPVFIDYFARWINVILTNPSRKNEVGKAIVLISEQGVGKNLLIEDILGRRIMGDDYLQVINSKNQFNPRFNGENLGKILTILDECSFGGNVEIVGELKSLITQTLQMTEEKFKNKQKIEDLRFFVVLTNEPYPVRVEKSNRRYAAQRCADEHINDLDFWRKVTTQMKDDEAISHFMRYFLNYESENFEFKNIPDTAALDALKELAQLPHCRFFRQLLAGELDFAPPGEETRLRAKDFYRYFVSWLRDGGYNEYNNETTFFGWVRDETMFKKDSKITKHRDSGGYYYSIDLQTYD